MPGVREDALWGEFHLRRAAGWAAWKGGGGMAGSDRNIAVHEYYLKEQAGKVKLGIMEISQKDSLNDADTRIIRLLTEVYDALTNPVPGKK